MKIEIDGHPAFAYTGGKALDARLPGVVLIHGALHDHSAWIQQSRYLAHHGRAVLAVDLPAHGRSGGAPLSVEGAAAWVIKLVQAVGLQRVTLAGHSMGSLIALEAAAALGDAAHHLVMVGTCYPMIVPKALTDLALADPLAAMKRVNATSNSTHAAKPSHPGPGFSIHGGNLALMRRNQAGWRVGNLFHHDFSACDAYRGLEIAAARLRCPTTLVLGALDQMTPPKATAAMQAHLKARVITLPVGHNLMAEAPDGVLNALVEAASPPP
jgi:pimeloyl-ACP methyl ester carboxylesterase